MIHHMVQLSVFTWTLFLMAAFIGGLVTGMHIARQAEKERALLQQRAWRRLLTPEEETAVGVDMRALLEQCRQDSKVTLKVKRG